MIIDSSLMFAVSLAQIQVDDVLDFPIYLRLDLNRRYVPVMALGDTLGETRAKRLRERNYSEVFIPNSFRAAWDAYLQAKLPKVEIKVQQNIEPASVEPAPDGVYEETEIVAEVLQDEDLSPEAKAEILASLGQDLLRAFNQISNRGDNSQQEAVKRGRQIADEILAIAAQDSNIYEDILALRQSKPEIEHSIMVSTLSVMFGLALGYADEVLLADMATAGLFHDIGLTKVHPLILAKPEDQWTAADRLQYQDHVPAGVNILKSAKAPYSETVFMIIRQHHENYDGSGFPERLAGARIPEPSQVVHLANWFDRLSSGKLDGETRSPGESIEKIFSLTLNPKAVKEVQPELIQKIFQFMLEEKEAAESLHMEAAQRAETVRNNQKAG